MIKIFLNIYDWFERHRTIFYSVLLLSVVALSVMASRVSLQENITSFFSGSDDKKSAIFENVTAKDKIIVMLRGENPDTVIESAELFEEELYKLKEKGLISSITAHADEEAINKCSEFIYDNLPIFLDKEDYIRLEENISRQSIEKAVDNAYNLMTSPSGMIIGDIVMRDPVNIGTPLLQKFAQFNPGLQYEIYDSRIFTKDLSTMLIFIQPTKDMGNTGYNDALVSGLEQATENAEINGTEIECIGGSVIAVYNARQIKKDTAITLSIALVFIIFIILFSFKDKWSIPLIITPPIFGALFSLAMIWLIQGEISAIAIGAGAVVLGISLSYSIHIVAHHNNTPSPREIIKELVKPLTIGCFTTIGAFAALMYTSSPLLQDMGLFSVLALIGTTIFSLVFLPQFLRRSNSRRDKSRLLNMIENVVGYRYEKSKFIVLPIILLLIISLFFYQKVEFDADMSNINYMPKHIAEAEERIAEISGDENKAIYIVTADDDLNTLTEEYRHACNLLKCYADSGKIQSLVTVSDFVIPESEQRARIAMWNKFWQEHRDSTIYNIGEIAHRYGFKSNAFNGFKSLITKEYSLCHYTQKEIGDIPVISEWINTSGGHTTLLCKTTINEEHKEEVYEEIDRLSNTAIIDRSYFSSKMVESTGKDFNYLLLVSSLIVFIALFVSYGRIELTLLTFLPMAISWVIILGMMAAFNIKFNIVNIILATFIFGIGDDFSIFITDGLMQEYRNGKKLLSSHKTAIFFSAFTAIVGMGVLIFAQHPALKSIALISVIGLSIVVLVSYTVQPMLFRLLVTSHTKKGGFPYTLGSILNTIYCFVYFLVGCIILQTYMLILMPLPIKRHKKKLSFHKVLYWFARIFLATMVTVRTKKQNPFNEKYDKPAVIIANHQSFVDILLLLSLTPKLVMVTNSWVWNSPFFGWIVKYADFHHSADGYEKLAERLQERIAEGYSVVIFPEGTRSADCSILRFHKGAFYLAHLLKLDILPILIYGAGQISAKKQAFYIKSGIVATKTMQRVKHGDTSFGDTYQEQSKKIRQWYVEQYTMFNNELGRASNAYFRDAITKNYIYKGSSLEREIRTRCHIDGYYGLWDRLIPRKARIVDIGCGYGQQSFMLGLLSPERTILGIDSDISKVEVAQHSFLCKKTNVKFICADVATTSYSAADAILLGEFIHSIDTERKSQIMKQASRSLNKYGIIAIRGHRHNSDETSAPDWINQFAQENSMTVNYHNDDKYKSATLYILTATNNKE